MSDQLDLPDSWRDVSGETGHMNHWHRGEEGTEEWASIRLADERDPRDMLHATDSGWSVEMYPHPERNREEVLWDHFEDRADAVKRVEELMETYQ